jgi:hypothetical protein
MDRYSQELVEHYSGQIGGPWLCYSPLGGRAHELPAGYFLAEFAPHGARPFWVYATVGMGTPEAPLELILEASTASPRHADVLAWVAHYHCTGARLGLHHTVNLGEPWMPGSSCTRAYVSLPYRYGPALEHAEAGGRSVRCLQLVPITEREHGVILDRGVEAL